MSPILLTLILSLTSFAQNAKDQLFAESQGRVGPRTNSVLIYKNNKLIFEKYDRGYDSEKKHIMWSISKTVTSLLYAIAEYENKISRDDSICKYVVPIESRLCEIKLQNVLNWTTGIRWIEEYERSSRLRQASILAMLYGEGRRDMARFVLSHPLEFTPGSTWKYSSGDTILLMRILQNVYKDKPIREVFAEKLFGPLGITDFTLEGDKFGTAGGAYFFYLKPKDLAKIGQLILGAGEYNQKRFYSKEWLKFQSTSPDAFMNHREEHDGKNIGGGHIWINNIKGTDLKSSPWPEAPQDTLMAMGHWGQYLLVNPSEKIVAVRTGDTRDDSFNSAIFAKLVMMVSK